ncbi:MAG TPA: hypothetical protein VLQ45_14470 [Thermoanaerobaculia bacterium]|nr:hypothetical protein [Thermoanaerobaculia bacterium]
MIAPVLPDDAAVRFPSLASLRVAHGELLRQQRESTDPELRANIETFIRRGQATGALLDENENRWEAQSILDYWATFLFRADRTTVDATLDEFDPELAPALDDAACPYMGLDAFRESKFEVFFGRQRMIQALLERLASERFLAVVGDSGSGKSSLVLAGLLPALKAGLLPGSASWRYLPSLVPGPDPLANLACALSPAGTDAGKMASQAARLREEPRHLLEMAGGEEGRPCVLVIDQFEELFTLCEEEPVRQAFVDALTHLIQSSGLRHTVLLTLRSDYEPRVAQLGTFQALFESAHVRVTPLGSPELREAIVRPAELVGLKFEDGVIDALLHDILGEPAGLPLLQFTLLKLWESRERNRVTWEAYRRLGGGRLALARSADDFYNSLIPQEQVTARRILLRMVRTSERLEVTSSRIQRKELHRGGEDPGRVNRVLDKLVDARLVRLTPGETREEDQFEVAHEALVRNWPTLVEWLEQERAEITTRRRLDLKVEEWLRLKKQGGLLDEVQLLEAERWLASSSASLLGYHPELPALAQASRNAIDEGKRKEEEAHRRELEQAQQLVEAARERAEYKTRSSRIFRFLTVVLAGLFLFSLFTSRQAIDSIRKARESERLAEQARGERDRTLLRVEQTTRMAAEKQSREERTLRHQAEQALKEMRWQKDQAEKAQKDLQRQKDLTEAALKEANDQKQLAGEALESTEAALAAVREQERRASSALTEAREAQERLETEKRRAEDALAKFEEQKEIAETAQEQVVGTRSQNVQLKVAYDRPSSRLLSGAQELKLDRRSRPLRLGASISSSQGGTGSLCCVVKDHQGRRYLLSLPPIFDGEPGTAILQPGQLDGGRPEKDQIAVLSRVGKDRYRSGAIARLQPGVDVDFRIPKIGKIRGIETTVYPGDKVRLVGRGSGILEGKVISANDREVVTTIVPSSGDVGGAVLADDGDLVGLLYGGDKLQSFVVRIKPILQELSVELVEE